MDGWRGLPALGWPGCWCPLPLPLPLLAQH